jgi:hypothetical protein
MIKLIKDSQHYNISKIKKKIIKKNKNISH